MATIDTSNIEGFDAMSAEEKVNVLLGIDVPDGSAELARMKSALDKATSEAAGLKKKLQGKMTEEEAAAAERAAELDGIKEQMAALQADNEKLRQERTESIYKAKYLAMPGFDEKLAEETAKAMAAGDMDKVFDNQQKANEAYKKQVQAEMVKGDPKPGGAGDGNGGEQDKATEIAELIGSERAKELESSNNILKHYLGG